MDLGDKEGMEGYWPSNEATGLLCVGCLPGEEHLSREGGRPSSERCSLGTAEYCVTNQFISKRSRITRLKQKRLTLARIFSTALERVFQGKIFTSFSMLRGLGLGKFIKRLKNSSLVPLPFDTVSGWRKHAG